MLFEKDQQKFLKLKQEIDPDIDAISMFYHLGVSLDDKPLYITTRHRLVKRSRNFQWTNKVHEVIQVKGNTAHSDIVITHCKERPWIGQDFKILQSIVEAGEATNIDRFNYTNECMFRKEYEEAIQQYKIVLESKEGWGEEHIYVYGEFRIFLCRTSRMG